MTAITEQITNQSVIDAVDAAFKQGREYRNHWNLYMSGEQKQAFAGLVAFEIACRTRRKWLVS